MRIILFFDLPMEKSNQIKQYNKFRRFLIQEGFIMLQKSVYSKLALNNSIANSIKNKIYKNIPEEGLIQVLLITEKQFSRIETIIGENDNDILDSTKRLIIL